MSSLPSTITTTEEEPLIGNPISVFGQLFEKPPEKVIVLPLFCAEIISECGFSAKIAGKSKYTDFPPDISSVPSYGTAAYPDVAGIIESFSALENVLVVFSGDISARDKAALTNAGIRSISISRPESIDELFLLYRDFGILLGGIENTSGEEAFSKLKLTSKDTDIGSFVYITKDFLAAGGNTLESSVFSLFGKNFFEEEEGYLGIEPFSEKLYLRAPDVIILSDIYTSDELEESGLLEEILEMGKPIITVPSKYFESPSGRLVILIDSFLSSYNTDNLGEEET